MDVAEATPGGLFDPATLAGAVTNAVVATQAAAAGQPTTASPNDGLVTPTSQALPVSSVVETPTSATPDDPVSSSSASPTSSSGSMTSSSLSSTPSSTNTADANGGGGYKFHITWLIPVFVLLGLLLLLAVGGKIWGRISFAKERAVKRQTRLHAQRKASMLQQRSQIESDYHEQGEWQEKGWGQYNHPPNPDESLEMQRQYAEFDAIEDDEDEYRKSSSSQDHRREGVELYDGPVQMPYDDGSETESEHELKGPLSALGGHLAGQRNGRALPPPARMEMERYGNMVKANSWWSVQWNRHFGADEDENGRYAGVVDEEKRRKSRDTASAWLAGQRSALGSTDNFAEASRQQPQQHTGNAWSRFKNSIGWGFDGSSPAMDMDRQNRTHAVVLTPQPPTRWSRIPLEDDENYTGDFGRRQSIASRTHEPVELFDAPVNLQRQQSFAQPSNPPLAIDRSLPPTPFSLIGTPAPANAMIPSNGNRRDGSLKRARTMETHTSTPNSQFSSRSHTMKEPQRSALSRSNTNNQAKRSKSLRFSEDVPKVQAVESDAEDDDDENNLRRYKSMSSAAASATSAAKEKNTSARKEGMSRQKTFAGPSSKPKRKPAPVTPDADMINTGKTAFTALKPVREVQKRPVNFGSDEENDTKISKPSGESQIPSVDSFVLARSRTKKQKQLDRINSLSEKDLNAMNLDEETVEEAKMKIDNLKEQFVEQEDLNRSPDLQAVDDLATEIDSVLLSVIARSNTSKSYARSVGGFASAAPTPHIKDMDENGSPSKFNRTTVLPPATPTTPMTPRTMARTGTWHKKNGRWVRTSPSTGKEQITSLQNTPIAAMGKTVPTSPFTPTGKTPNMKLPASLPRALLSGSPERKIIPLPLGDGEDRYTSHGKAGSVISSYSASGRSNVSESSTRSSKVSSNYQYAIGDSRGNLRPESGSGLMTNRRPVHSQISEHDLFFTSHQAPSYSGADSPTKSNSLRSNQSSTVISADEDTEQETREKPGFSPKRRAAMAKRTNSPRRYTAKLATGEEDEEDDENFDASEIIDAYNALKTPKSQDGDSVFEREEMFSPEQSNTPQQQQHRLHTGKSLRTPAEKKRERQYAMDRVQSIVTRAHAARLQKTPPELWMDN